MKGSFYYGVHYPASAKNHVNHLDAKAGRMSQLDESL